MPRHYGLFGDYLTPVLEAAPFEDLQFLVDLMLKKESNFIEIDERYKSFNPGHHRYYDLIAKEFR